jgi:transmembrane sensor
MTHINRWRPMDSSDSSDSLADRAEAWVILLYSGHATDDDRRKLAAWRAESMDHETAFRTAERLWRDMGLALASGTVVAREERKGLFQSSSPHPSPLGKTGFFRNAPPATHRRRPRIVALALATCLLASVVAVRMLGLTDVWLSDYHTATGERSEITLADGSRIILDTDTALSVHFGENVRRVELRRGRASFKVAPDPQHPFEVAGGAVTARALGTAYDVALSGNEVRVSVLEHSVAVRAAGSDHAVTLSAGQQAHWNGRELKGPEPADLRTTSAWRKGKLIFENRTLAEAIAELDRYRSGAILITSGELRALRVTGVFPLGQPDSVLNDMAATLKLRTTQLGPWITLLHR